MKKAALIGLTFLLVACAKEIQPGFDDGRGITFAVSGAGTMQVEESTLPETRSALVNNASSSFAFGVSEYNGSTAVSSFQNVQPAHESTISTDNELFNSHQRWEAPAYTGTDYSFYAYSPYLSSSAHGMTLQDGNRKIAYSLSGLSIANMPDLMTAYVQTGFADPVPLTFQHRLAAVGISLGAGWESGCTVSAIQFTNIITGGTLAVSAGKDAAWDSYGSRGSYTVPSGFSTTASTAGSVILGASSTWLMMVPQTLSGNNASIVVTISKSSTSTSITLPLSGTWEAGKTYSYVIDPPHITSVTATYPKWDDGSASGIDGPMKSYGTGSSLFGMYVVTPEGSVVYSNLPVGVSAVSGTNNSVATLSLPDGYYFPSKYRYFLYYPRKASPGDVVETATTAEGFFANFISGWSVSGTQNSETYFKAQDLQVGMLTGSAFTMKHAMGLAKITLANKTIANKRIFTYGLTTSYADDGTVSQAPPGFSSTTRVYSNGGSYWTVLKATGPASNTAVSFTSSTGTHGDSWSLSISDIGYGKYRAYTIETTLEYKVYVGRFPFTGGVQKVVVPWNGSYNLEVWGAQGCSFTTPSSYSYGAQTLAGGYGGYSFGKASLSVSEPLYVMVGEQGSGGLAYQGVVYKSFPNGGFGHAGDEVSWIGSGGGSTHIATSSALPKSLTAAQILIMAGGGGAAIYTTQGYWDGTGGSGGGYQGNSGTTLHGTFTPGGGGTQTAGGQGNGPDTETNQTHTNGSFGQGGGLKAGSKSGGGGGYYGGGAGWGSPGGGGSGYIGNSRLDSSTKKMYGYNVTASSSANTRTYSTTSVTSSTVPASNQARAGHGYAIITSVD